MTDSDLDSSKSETHSARTPPGAGELCDWSFGGLTSAESPAAFQAKSLRPGAFFGDRFRIEESLGKGGMGEVFRAFDVSTQRDIALKVMRKTAGVGPRLRFLREGELIAKLDHPGILRIHGGGMTVEGSPFLVLELVEGARPLDEALAADTDGGLDLFYQVARAVGYAHRQGVVHRDLKPGNVLVDVSGRVRVCDFGIAFSNDAERLTRSGEFVGTLIYMALECFSSKIGEVEPAVDVWALGVILYKHLTGLHPFDFANLSELIARISVGGVTPPREIRPEIPPAVEAVCLRALEKDPKDRFPDGDAFADALELATAQGQQKRPLRDVVALGAVGLAIVLLLSFVLRDAGDPRPPAHANPPPPIPGGDSTHVVAPPVPLDAERALAELLREAHSPTGFRQEVLGDFERVGRLANGHADLASRIQLERLGYLLRRGRWQQVLAEVSTLESEAGPVGAQATLLHAEVVYLLRSRGTETEAEALAACRQQWARPASERGALELACGAWLAIFEGRPELAADRAQQAQQLDPEFLSAVLAEAVAWGRILNIPKALALAERARGLSPDHPLPLFLLAMCRLHVKDHDLALEATEQAMTLLNPDPPWVACKFHFTSLLSLGRYRETEELAARGVDRHPSDPRWRFVLGLALQSHSIKRWRGLQILGEVRRTAPESFDRSLRHFKPIPGVARELLRTLDETSEAEIRAGLIYEQARGYLTAGDVVRGGDLMQEAAAAGLPEAMFIHGESYALGRGLAKDYSLAVHWYRKAAEAGRPGAMFGLGVCYADGRGIRRDRKLAFRWYLAAAEGGWVRAMINLGNAYRAGWGGEPDDTQAAHWFERAAATGEVGAMLNLGKLYAETGAPSKAARWWRKAAEDGDEGVKAEAARRLRVLRGRYPGLR